MPWGVVAAAAVSAYSSDKAADKASDAAKKGIKSTEGLAAQARSDAVSLFNQGQQSRILGQGAAFNLIKQNAQKVNQPLIQGNMMAQQAVGQGGIQANNAILGLPVDMSFANNPQQVQADYSGINNAQMPMLGTGTRAIGNGYDQSVVQSLQYDTRKTPYPVADGGYSRTGQPEPTDQQQKEILNGREVIFGSR